MPPVQGTFKVLPGLARSDVNNGPIRPMTSKQVKKAHKAATRQPKLSRAEQRRLELAEQERIRKEFEKEKTAARARAAKERKKQKELADKEAKRKKGLPLVAPRPSQETLSRFMWGNGSGLKRDGRGATVAPAPMAAVREESAQPDEDLKKPDDEEVKVEMEPAMDERSEDGADVHIEEPEQAHSPDAASPIPNAGAAQPEVLAGLQAYEEPIQPTNLHVDDTDDMGDPRLSAHAQSEPLPEVHGGKEHSQTADSHVREPIAQNSPQPIVPKPSISIDHTESPPVVPGEGEALRSAASEGSFILGSSDMIDDESLLELTESFEPKPVLDGQETAAPYAQNAAILTPEIKIPDNLPDNLPDGIRAETSDDLAALGAITQLFHDMDDDYDYEMIGDGVIESHEPPLEEAALPLPELHDETKPKAIFEDQVSPLPQRSQRHGLERKVSSFFGSELDDELLLQLELPGDVAVSQCCQPVDEQPQQESPPKRDHTIGSTGRRSTPSSPIAPRQRPPPSTQAILLNLDDYLPSSTQLALELDEDDIEEDFPVVEATNQVKHPPPTPRHGPSPASRQGVQPTMAAPQSAGPPIRPQKRFFSSSGSNESLHLALHLSRRTAALEGIRRNDQRRVEAGLLQGRTISQPQRHQHKRPKIPSFAVNYQVKHDPPVQNATRIAKTMIDEVSRPSPPNPTKGNQSTRNEQSGTKSAVAIKGNDTNKENIPPEPVTDDLLGSGLPASQETEYGGAWMDDIGLDLVI